MWSYTCWSTGTSQQKSYDITCQKLSTRWTEVLKQFLLYAPLSFYRDNVSAYNTITIIHVFTLQMKTISTFCWIFISHWWAEPYHQFQPIVNKDGLYRLLDSRVETRSVAALLTELIWDRKDKTDTHQTIALHLPLEKVFCMFINKGYLSVAMFFLEYLDSISCNITDHSSRNHVSKIQCCALCEFS